MGTSGSSGTSGLDGTFFGSSGTSGTNATGIAGTSGTSGTTPPNFTSGTSGFNGTSGTSATGVTSGTSGSSGFVVSGNTDDGIVTYVASTFSGNVESNLTFNGSTLTVTGNIVVTTSLAATTFVSATTFRETYVDRGTGGSITLDLSTGNNFRRQFNGNASVAFSNAPASNAFGFTLVTVNAGAYTIAWPGNVDWAGGSQPTLTSVGTDILVFYTYDGGSTYYGFVSGKNFS